MGDPSVSIVIPLFNKSATVARCVESALNQSWPSIEVILVDDGSTDRSLDVAKTFLADRRVRVFSKENGGAGSARNFGVSRASGAYVAFLDADDAFLYDHIETAVRSIAGRTTCAYYSPVIFDRGGVRHTKPSRGIGRDEAMSEYYVSSFGLVSPTALVLDSKTARAIRWDESIGFGDDFDYALRLFAGGVKFIFGAEAKSIAYHEYQVSRLSNSGRADRLIEWVESHKTLLTERAYVGFYGSQIAAHSQSTAIAWWYFGRAVVTGCFSATGALRTFAKIALPRKTYVRTTDRLLSGWDRVAALAKKARSTSL